jgi:predicted nucleic acid-binding Zn ribbon protein
MEEGRCLNCGKLLYNIYDNVCSEECNKQFLEYLKNERY